MTEDAPPLASHAGDLERLYHSVNDAGGRAALERVAQRISELTADNEALRKQLAERGSAEEAVDSIPGLVVALAPDGEVEFVNRKGVELFGQPLEELKHWGTNGAIHPEDLPRLIEDFTKAIASGQPFEWEVRPSAAPIDPKSGTGTIGSRSALRGKSRAAICRSGT